MLPGGDTPAWDNFCKEASRLRNPTSTKRVLDIPATLAAYERRMRDMPLRELQELDGCFLSTFDCYCNIMEDVPNDRGLCNSAVVLMRVARSRGVRVLGVTSERKARGAYCVRLPPPHIRGETPVVYVSKYNYFTNNSSSKWRLLPTDRVFRDQVEISSEV